MKTRSLYALVAIGLVTSPVSVHANCTVPGSEPWFMHQEDCSMYRRKSEEKNVEEICRSVPRGTKDALYRELEEQDSEFIDAALGRGARIAVKTIIKTLLGKAAGRAFDAIRPEVANAPTMDDELKETLRVAATFEEKYLSVQKEAIQTFTKSSDALRTSNQMFRYGDIAQARSYSMVGQQLAQKASGMKAWTDSRANLMSSAGDIKACSAMLLEQRRR